MSIYKSAVEKPITTLMIFVAILVLGVFSYIQLPVDLMPKMDPPYITVMATYPGANATDIEENVTKILEDRLNSVDDLKELTSKSYENLAVITLEFEWEANLDEASNDVRDAVDQCISLLPEDIDRPTIMRFNTSMMPILIYAVTAEESYPGLNKIIDDKVVTRMNQIDGVASVTLSGVPERVVYVDLNPIMLDAYNLTIEGIGNAILAENMNVSSGNVKMTQMDYSMRVEGEFEESEEIANIPLGVSNGKTVFLKDVAQVRDTIKDITLESLVERGDGAVLLISKQSDANAVQVAEEAKAILAECQKDLPSDVHFEIISDNSDFIVKSINNLQETLMYALIFVVLVVFFFLGRWRATFIIALTIPISLIVAFIYLLATGESLNIISLTSLSIAIGMVVDDAIVVLENITKHIERGSHPKEAAKYGTNEVWVSVIVTTLVTVAVFFPLTLVTGMTGILFKQLGWIVCITVCTSTVTAISLTPMLCSQLMHMYDPVKLAQSKFSWYTFTTKNLDKLDNWYEKLVRWCLNHKTVVITSMTLVFVGSCGLSKFIETDFMPQNDQSNMNVFIKMQTGQKVELTKKIALEIDSVIRAEVPEIRILNLSYGSEETASFASMMSTTGTNVANMRIRVVDIADRDRDVFQIADQVRNILKRFPEVLVYTVSTSSGGSMGSNNVTFEIVGHDFSATSLLAAELAEKAKSIEGAEDINISRDDDKAELQFIPDRDKLARHGLSASAVGAQLRNRIYGYRNAKFKEDGEEYDIIVRLQEDFRASITDVENIIINDARGNKVRLKELGEIKEFFSPPNIERKTKQRYLSVTVTPAMGASMGTIAEQMQQIINETEIPSDITVYVGGSYEDQQESFESLFMLLALSLMLVYIVMAAEFESYKMPFIIMLSIPFAFSGVILALLMTNSSLSIVAALGAVMLVGIVTKNGIVLIDYINLMRERGVKLYEAIALSCRSRLRPVLMTSLTTILGMVPMAFSQGEGAETWRPMGVAVIGGMVFSTIITMLIIPVVYASMDKSGSRNKKKDLKKQYAFMSDFDAERDLPKLNK